MTYSLDLKSQVIRYYKKIKSCRQIANIFQIGKSTVNRWINSLKLIHKKRNNKYSIDIINYIIKIVKNNPFTNIKYLYQSILSIFKIKISFSKIYNILKDNNFSYKRTKEAKYNKNINELNHKRELFDEQLTTLSTDDIISIDETYIYESMTPYYGWSLKGQTIKKFVKSNQQKYSILMAISNNKIISYKYVKGNIDSFIFCDFINQLNKTMSNKYFLMDNVSFHKSNNIRTIINNANNQILFIPPYSPDYNPIEMVFSKMKKIYKNQNTDINMGIRLKNSIKSISPQELQNYYNHSFK